MYVYKEYIIFICEILILIITDYVHEFQLCFLFSFVGETFLLVDLILESLLRGVIHWLCDNNWVTSEYRWPNNRVNISFEIVIVFYFSV